MEIKNFIQNVLLILTIYGIEAKHNDKDNNENSKEQKPEKAIYPCESNDNCTNLRQAMEMPDMAFCNVTSHTCTNYCFLNQEPCFNNYDCGFSIGDPKRCPSECYRRDNQTSGICLIISKQGQDCGETYIQCEEGLTCDFYTGKCITLAEAQNQTGEPLFSLFLFMLIMLSLFNRQRADEDILNNMAPNELLMVTLPSRRHQPEDDILPVYQPIDGDANEDEVIEQNLVVPEHPENSSSEQNQSTEDVGIVVDDDDLPLLPPTYDEAVSGFVGDSTENLINPNEQNPPPNSTS